jgi:glucan phosphoethanolaminetransferase (alkaline phosphatase superfamily)
MIQRIQSLFLALVVILGVLFSYLPILEFFANDATYIMNAYNTVDVTDVNNHLSKNMGVGVMQGLVFILALVLIFLFKNRQLQMKLAKLNILLISLQIAAIVMYSDTTITAIGSNVDDVSVNIKLGAIIPVLSLILTYLAIRFIKKDENLVRAADRLR